MTQTPLHETDETDVKTASASRRVRLFPDVTDNDNGPDKYILVKSMDAGGSVEGNYISGGSMLAEDGSSACVSAGGGEAGRACVSAGGGEAGRADKSEGSGAAIAVSLTPTASIAIATLSQLENELENEHNSTASGINSFNCSMEHTLESSPTNPTITVFRERWREVIVVTCLAALWGVSYYTVFVWMSYYVSKPELMTGLENDSQVEKESEVSVLDRY